MNAPFKIDEVNLDQLRLSSVATVIAIDWAALAPADAARLRHFGFDDGVRVESLHLGPFGRDPMAVRVGRMTVAIRRKHAAAIRVLPDTK